jgi:hypothetical protein
VLTGLPLKAKLKEGWCEMIGKAIKKVGSAVTRAAQSAPKPAYKLPPVIERYVPKLPAVKSAPPAPTSARQRFGGLGAGFRNEFGGGAGMAPAPRPSVSPAGVLGVGLGGGAGDSGALNAYRDMNKQMAGIAGTGRQMVMKKGGKVSSASKRADGIAIRGKTRA